MTKKLLQNLSVVLLLILLIGCRSEDLPKNEQKNINAKISIKKLNEISDLIPVLNDIRSQMKNATNLQNKGIEDLDLDEVHIVVMDFQDNGRTISINVNQDFSETSYFVMNLNILQHDGIETYYITKYIPADGKPFYNYSNFIGTVEIYDLNGNLITSSNNSGRQLHFSLGCFSYVINDNAGFWQIQSVACNYGCSCDGGGGGSTGSGGSSGGNSGDGGYPGDGSNNGGSGGGGGGSGSGGSPMVPNIPTENFMEQRKYEAFLNQLTSSQLQFLAEHADYNNNVFNYVKANNFNPSHYNLMSVVINHLISNTNNSGVHILWEDLQPMFGFVKKFLYDNPDTNNKEQIFARIKALNVLLEQNPNGLLDIPCTELSKWQQLANYQIPLSVKNRVNQINSQAGLFDSASLQSIFTGGGPSLNMDYFAVKINTLPNKPGTSQQYTPSEFFDHFRKNINNFVYGSSFTPVVNGGYNINDTALWNSSNPLGALIHIEIPGNNGTVICSEFNNQQWIFTTVDIPWDDQHPVSGNRRFGYYMEGGAMYVYARGVDRFTFNFLNYSATWFAEGIGFNKADELWSSFQTKISQFVNNGGGQSVIIPSTKYRPSWIKIRNYIKGTETISALGCH